jgi:tRNA(Ile)-lysidine synthase
VTSALLDEGTIQRIDEISPAAPILIALSGGGDSTALLHLMRDRFGAGRLIAVVIDHALREGSMADAARAAAFAKALGVRTEVVTLTWPDGPKRAQASAREARHRALCAAAKRAAAAVIAIGHTSDDQAETILMRAAAGSSWRGLAGMRAIAPAPVWPEGRGLLIARPLLGARRADLRAYLRARGADWIEDASNENIAFARVRVRERLARLEAAGLAAARLVNLAAKLRPIVDGVEADAARLILDAARIADGAVMLELSAWVGGLETRRRALSALIAAVSGAAREIGADAAAPLEARLNLDFEGATLGGARLRRKAGAIVIERVKGALLGRAGGAAALPNLALPVGVESIWDNRLALVANEEGWSAAPAPGEGPVLTKSEACHSLAEATACGLVTARWLTKERIAHSFAVHRTVTGRVA